ncbi:MAG: ABC transporter ATP-binding protein [Candidatus Viridilinea halotolerans]|uniref:ABC transporter ATP-binding protein n=1 Tax=Candidatus Viridilinea halotolerans TaxID=2491704 RepID=A0A426TQU2_9CHLR|nr:MAG: ABC transporter ATP-binding protein [Candidatus Viridilinea halotolerans]
MNEALRRRRIRWGVNGALILAAVAIVLGGLFNVLIAIAEQRPPSEGATMFWLGLLVRSSLAWGLGAIPFGAALGVFASMIWRHEV